MSMKGELWFFLGLHIWQTLNEIFLNQSKFTKDLVSKFRLNDSKLTNTLIRTSEKITENSDGVNIDPTYYKSIIGNLLYLITSRLDITFNFGNCVHYQAAPKEFHLKVAKRVIRYFHGTVDFSLWYLFETTPIVVRFSDVDCAGNVDDRKSTSRGCFYVGNYLISWHSCKQNFISLSTTEVEYIVTKSGCRQLLWMKLMLKVYELLHGTMNLFLKNSSVIQISKNLVQHSRTKYINIHHHFIRYLVEEKVLSLEYVKTED